MNLKNETGITLVELLAALSILSVVILLAGSIHIFGQRHFTSQSESASDANNISYALSVMSSDLRRYSPNELRLRRTGSTQNLEVGNEIWIIEEETAELLYSVQGKELKKDQIIIADSIHSLEAKFDGTYGITIRLISDSEYSNPKVYETTIVFRGVADEN